MGHYFCSGNDPASNDELGYHVTVVEHDIVTQNTDCTGLCTTRSDGIVVVPRGKTYCDGENIVQSLQQQPKKKPSVKRRSRRNERRPIATETEDEGEEADTVEMPDIQYDVYVALPVNSPVLYANSEKNGMHKGQ